MKKNKLYTVNKWNQPAFMYAERNIFWPGGDLTGSLSANNPSDFWGINSAVSSPTQLNPNSLNVANLQAKNAAMSQYLQNYGRESMSNPLSFKEAFSSSGLKRGLKAGAGAAISTGAGLIGGLAGNAISGGLSSGAGDAIGSIGSTVGSAVGAVNPILGAAVSVGSQLVGGLVNRAFGTKVDQAKLNAANEGTSKLRNFTSTATSFDDVKGPEAMAKVIDPYSGGWFSSGKARRKNEELKQARAEAKSWAERGVVNNIDNLVKSQMDNALADYFAYGGPMDFGGGALGLMQQNRYFDTIDKRSEAIAGKGQTMQTGFTGSAKTFADGGLKASFMDEFGKDPIAAAVRYNQGLEAMAAQREAEKAEAAREAEYADMQNRLLSLETQNQGLQALMTAQNTPVVTETTEETAESIPSSSSPSAAAYNSNWDYIEDQLKRSGKFNDVQIQGIKYNLQRESGIGQYDGGDNGTARGLAQWRGNRIPKDLSLEGQTKYLIDTLSNYDGKLHWIGEDNYRGFMNARTPEEAHYYIARGYERPASNIIAKVKRDSDMSLKNLSAFGGELGTNGTDFTNGLLYIDEGGSHEENPLEGVPMGLDPQGIPNLVEEGETVYNDYVFSDRMKVPFFMYKELGLGGVMKKKGKEMSFADASKKLAQESEQRPNDPISQDGLEASLARLAEVQEAERMRKQGKEYMGLEGYACGGKMGNKYKNGGSSSNHKYGVDASTGTAATAPDAKENPTLSLQDLLDKMGRPSILQDPTKTPINPDDIKIKGSEYLPGGSEYVPETNPKTYDTWMRYAPAVGAGVMTLTDMLGLTNKPDYTYAGKLEAAAERAGYAPNIDYKPIGNYLTYRPMDIWYQQNALNAQARATDRALTNSSSPSRAAGLLANGYNSQLASGNLYRQALEYNDAKRKDVAEFNRKTNMFNSQMDLEAAMANARYQQVARQMGLSGLAQAAALRDSIDARVGASRSANLTNFLTSLGNIGRENFAMNQINTDRSRNYYGRLNGDVGGYKRKGACGGKLNRK